ncbi:hypothetical protein PIB30_079939, partial [Stylosanthes scabra]|nr:hypothetical protein [Stylosanthes scabra]
YFRPLGIEKGIGKAKEGNGSKRSMKKSQKRNRAPSNCTTTSCDSIGPWEHRGSAPV